MYDIINFVHKNYFDDLSLDVLAQRFHINKYYLCARFKNVTGMSPAQYLINCRILKAKELLLRDYSVEEVCDLAGFNNLPHFSRSFKQHTGHSPKQYQLTMHNDSPGAAGEIGVSGVSEEPSAPSRKTAAGPFTRTAKFNL
jgi:AraC-like DNA-binding protein